VLPPALHILQCPFVRLVTARDDVIEVLVLRFYHLVGGVSVVWEVAWATQLFAGHRFHRSGFLSSFSAINAHEFE
jgi:hypothetical protein